MNVQESQDWQKVVQVLTAAVLDRAVLDEQRGAVLEAAERLAVRASERLHAGPMPWQAVRVFEDVLDALADALEGDPVTPRHITTVETRGGVL